jgi:hypothetical protein
MRRLLVVIALVASFFCGAAAGAHTMKARFEQWADEWVGDHECIDGPLPGQVKIFRGDPTHREL